MCASECEVYGHMNRTRGIIYIEEEMMQALEAIVSAAVSAGSPALVKLEVVSASEYFNRFNAWVRTKRAFSIFRSFCVLFSWLTPSV